MAKGRTNQPLVIDMAPQWIDHPAVVALRAAGHVVHEYGHHSGTPDWICHPAAGWSDIFFTQHTKEDGTVHRPFVEARLKAERARKRGQR